MNRGSSNVLNEEMKEIERRVEFFLQNCYSGIVSLEETEI